MTLGTSETIDIAHGFNSLAELSDDDLRAMVASSELPPLLATIANLTGDRKYLDPAFAPPLPQRGATQPPHGGLYGDTVTSGRELALEGLHSLQQQVQASTDSTLITDTIAFLGGESTTSQMELLRHEIDPSGDKPLYQSESLPAANLTAIVIGAGVSGLAAAINLRASGVAVTILERHQEVGGVWWENTYPGCRLDTPNFTYSYSFAQRDFWPEYYSKQSVVRDYLIDVSHRFELRDLIEFGSNVDDATFDEESATWTVTVTHHDGTVEQRRANVLVTAVGQLNRPHIPDIEGLSDFAGPMIHSARWDHGVDFAGKRVAVIGTGASAFQIIPELADQVESLTVFQRSAPWMLPAPNYHDDVTGPLRNLFMVLPQYGRWYRFWQFVLSLRAWLPLVKVDPDWDQTSGSVSSLNAGFRDELLEVLANQFTDRPDLYDLCAPNYPPGTKRLLRDSGAWGRTLRQPHVHVNTSSITRFDGNTLVTADGQRTKVDIVVLATGFLAEEFLAPMEIRGRDGVLLEDWWKGDARAYATATVPHFPNMFMMLGPNSGLAANGSMVFIAECAAEFIVRCLETMVTAGARTIEPTESAYHRFSDKLDMENRLRAWGVAGASTWYQNKYGRASQSWPLELADYWEITHNVVPGDHVFR